MAKNYWYAEQARAATNVMADSVEAAFHRDSVLAERYENVADGKWNHMMAQSNIGYTSWDDPDEDIMPQVERIDIPQEAEMGVASEGTKKWWPNADEQACIATF